MVLPTRPNSTTGQWFLTNRASEVPPVVESSGHFPVSAKTAFDTISESRPGGVKKLSPEIFISTPISIPVSRVTRTVCSLIQSLRL